MCVKITKITYDNIFLLTLFVFLFYNFLSAGDTIVWTPEGRPVPADTPTEMSSNDIAWCHWYIQYYYIEPYQLNAVRIGNASNTYNCHGYAWSLSEDSEQVWIGTYEDHDVETYYWTDGSWSNDGQPSYFAASEAEATHAWYNPGDHSVRKIQNSYPCEITSGRDYVSKWGYFGLYQHAKGHDIYRLKSTTGFDFKKLKTTHYGTLSSYYKKWIGAGGKAHTISNNVVVPSGATLTIKSGAIVDLNSYSITSTGGTITIESGATINPDIRLQTGSTINGLYPTINAAFSAASGGQSVHIRGTHNFADHFTVPSGKTLKTESNSQMNFASGKYLYVYGTLNAYNTTYTATSGTWGGIKYYSGSSGTIQYANINNAYVGIYANNSSPSVSHVNISDCTYGVRPYSSNISVSHSTINNCNYGVYAQSGYPNINNCTYGVYLRYSNAGITSNAITGCTRGVYGYCADYTDIVNNLITSGASSRVAGVQVYDTDEPNLYNNTIEGSFTYGLDADHYSRPMAIGPGGQNYQGYNRIIGGGTATVYARDHSEAVFGTGFTQSTEGYAGYNTIYIDTGQEKIAHIRAENYSNILAQKNYWGDYPPMDFYADGTSSINYSYPLSSDPGGGSSLGKIAGGLTADLMTLNDLPFDDAEPVLTLWLETTSQWQSLQYRKALDNCNTLLQNYPDSPYAPLALLRAVYAKRALKNTDIAEYLQKFVGSDSLRTMALELLIGENIRRQQFSEALADAETVLRENPGSEAEYKALFGLFNLYATDLEDKEGALAVLDVMKSKYPDYGLTQMAQFEMGEEVDWELAKPIVFGEEPKPEVVSILPEKIELKPNYPNPFNPTTNIAFALPEAAKVQILIYDLTGREIWRSSKTSYPAGNHTLAWNGVNQAGESVVSGIYMVRMITPKYSATQRILLMK
jgi:tetratricopeptide (TPR) repeat protein